MYATLTNQLQGPAAPTSFKVCVIPTDGGDPFPKELQTIHADVLKDNRENLKPHYENIERLNAIDTMDGWDHLVFYVAESFPKDSEEGVCKGRYDDRRIENGFSKPDVRLLPDTRSMWPDAGWEKRAALAIRGYHLFYTRAKGGLLAPNQHSSGQVSGEMFLLRVSDSEDNYGKRFYVDAYLQVEEVRDMIKDVNWSYAGLGGGRHLESIE